MNTEIQIKTSSPAEQTSVEVADVQVDKEAQKQKIFRNLFQHGKLVKIHISQWSMRSHLSKDELETKEELPDFVIPGVKFLIKPEVANKFTKLEKKARNYLRKNSLPYLTDCFVPSTKYIEVMTQLEGYREEWEKLVAEFLQNYDTYKNEMLQSHPQWYDRLVSCYPKKEHLVDRFGFLIVSYEIQIPTNLEKIDVHSFILREQKEEEVKSKLEKRLREQQDLILKSAEKFAFDAAYQLRETVNETVTALIQKIQKKQLVTKTNKSTLKNLITDFRAMNLLDDKEMSNKLNTLDKILDSNESFDEAENKIGLTALQDALNDIKKTADNLSDVDTLSGEFFRKLAI